MHSKKAVVLFSGGQDSTTCLYWALDKFEEVKALSIYYGQRHDNELISAAKIANMAGIAHSRIDLSDLFKSISDSALLNKKQDVFAEHRSGNLPASFVPGRNLVMLTTAAMFGFKFDIFNVVTGVCQTDYSGYPDCRADTIRSLQTTLNLGMFAGGSMINIHTPLMELTKAETVELACNLPGCLDALAYSHTCYEGLVPPCGRCPSCILRAKGFQEAGISDPLIMRNS